MYLSSWRKTIALLCVIYCDAHVCFRQRQHGGAAGKKQNKPYERGSVDDTNQQKKQKGMKEIQRMTKNNAVNRSSWGSGGGHTKQIQKSTVGEKKANHFKVMTRKVQTPALNLVFQRKDGRLTTPTNNKRIGDGLMSKVRDFYARDFVSRTTAGKRLSLCWIPWKSFRLKKKAPSLAYSYGISNLLWVVHLTLRDRNTCNMQENLGFLVQKLHHLISTVNLDDLVKATTCDTKYKMHVWRMFWVQWSLLPSFYQ